MHITEIKKLWREKKFDKALKRVEALLSDNKESAQLWNLRGDLIQLSDANNGAPLPEAEKCYKTALRLKPNDLEAIESLAHFYDAVILRRVEAKRYAKMYIRIAREGLTRMTKIAGR